MSEWLPKYLPEDIECERSFLATCCAPGVGILAAEAVAMLQVGDFVHPAHKALFSALVALAERGEEVNSLTLKFELEAARALNRVGGFPGLVDLLAGEDVERPQVLAKVLQEKSRLRQIVHLGAKLVRDAAEEVEISTTLASQAVDGLVALCHEGCASGGLVEIGSDLDNIRQEILDVSEGRSVPGVSTGFSKLDLMLGGGWKPGQLIILAARPGVGKSTLAQGFSVHHAEKRGRVAFWSLEMSKRELQYRMAASRCGIHSNALASGQFGQGDLARLDRALAEIKALPLLVDDRATTNIPIMRGAFDRNVARKGPIDLGVVDYLQLVKNPSSSAAARQNESVRIGEISRDLKLFAKDRGLPLIVLSQMNREVEHRTAARPQLSDLRDSGAIEQDADVVLFIHRSTNSSLNGVQTDRSAELIVAKNRNGPTGIVRLVQDLSQFKFVEEIGETAAPSPSQPQDPWAGFDL